MTARHSLALPATLALIDPDPAQAHAWLGSLQVHGVATRWFADAEAWLVSEQPFGFDFYVLGSALPGVGVVQLVQVLRRRSQAGVLVTGADLPAELGDQALHAGADLCLAGPVPPQRLLLGVGVVYRRSGLAAAPISPEHAPAEGLWQVVQATRQLRLPDGQMIALSGNDLSVLCLLAQAPGHAATREQLSATLNLSADSPANLLTATMYRLRRRIERHYTGVAPLQSRANVGYIFKAPLRLA